MTDPRLLPPPHIFLGNILEQGKYFNTAQTWQIGIADGGAASPAMSVLYTILSSTGRVLAGLALATIVALVLGVAARYFALVERLALPTITLLAPVSPVAWLPIAIFLFGIGNKPAIFMVFIALVFTMTIATIAQIDGVNRNYINVARTMGATKRQIYTRIVIPAILPGLLVVLRMNLFRGLDGGACRGSDQRRDRSGAGRDACPQYVQSVASVFYDYDHRPSRVRVRHAVQDCATACSLLGSSRCGAFA